MCLQGPHSDACRPVVARKLLGVWGRQLLVSCSHLLSFGHVGLVFPNLIFQKPKVRVLTLNLQIFKYWYSFKNLYRHCETPD